MPPPKFCQSRGPGTGWRAEEQWSSVSTPLGLSNTRRGCAGSQRGANIVNLSGAKAPSYRVIRSSRRHDRRVRATCRLHRHRHSWSGRLDWPATNSGISKRTGRPVMRKSKPAPTVRKFREKGAVAVEFALILPIFLALTFGIVEYSRAFSIQVSMAEGAREAARYTAIHYKDAGVLAAAAKQKAIDAAPIAACSPERYRQYLRAKSKRHRLNHSQHRVPDGIADAASLPPGLYEHFSKGGHAMRRLARRPAVDGATRNERGVIAPLTALSW